MKYILLDGNSFCYRAFYAIRDLRTSKGEPTNAIYGVIVMLDKIVKHIKPDGVAVTFDLKGPTHRHKKYDQYKIHRSPMPEDLVGQMPKIKEVIEAMNIPIFEKEGYEADDIIATLATTLEKKGHEVFIVTGDKDMMQLVTKKVKVVNPQKDNLLYDAAEVEKKFGVGPDKVVDILALMGDASDNIPGVPGIGEKTATTLVKAFGSVEELLKNLNKFESLSKRYPRVFTDKLKDNLVKHQGDAILSKDLATVMRDVPIDVDIEGMRTQEPNQNKLAELYQHYEFRTLLKNVPSTEPKNTEDKALSYHLITDKAAFESLKKKLASQKKWAFDFETTDINPLLAEPVGISFSFKDREAYFVSFGSELKAKACLGELKTLFEDPKIHKVGQNIKYEILILKNFGIELEGVHFDTMVGSYCLNPAKPNHNLDDIAMEHLGVRITDITELIGTGKSQITMDKVDLDKLYRYGCQDSDITLRLSEVLASKLEEKDLMGLFREIEMPLVKVLADIEHAGVAIDTDMLRALSDEMEKSLAELTKTIHREAGGEFNINSPKQLAEILFEKLGLPMVKKTKTGASTDVGVLQELSEIHSLPKEILKFRELSKLKSTYVDVLPELVNPRTKRVHTSFNQTVAATGRLSSTDPNLQNIPIRTAEGRKIRRAFVAGSKGAVLLSADYSQIELRVLAHLSEDEKLIEAFKKGMDIHRFTASLIFNVELKDVTDAMRSSAKTVNFGVLYGMGAFSLAKSLGIKNEAAKNFIKAYFDRYPSVKKYLDSSIDKAKKDGFVSTAFKRRRYIPEIHSSDPRLRSFAERTAINAPLQGTASDIIKIAMIRIAEKFKKKGFDTKMISQVHDELLFEGPRSEMGEVVSLVQKEMSGAAEFLVPLDVSVKMGPNWLDMQEFKE
jgi:DNA polymerase-1